MIYVYKYFSSYRLIVDYANENDCEIIDIRNYLMSDYHVIFRIKKPIKVE